MPGHLKPGVIKERAELLRKIAAEKRAAFQQRFINKPLPVLGQRHNPLTKQVIGLSRNYLEVCYPGSAQLLNQEVVVQIDGLEHSLLTGNTIPPVC
jgi:threonylcarbamoyladenosine tRNA methylthiotransferase MtaB